jgi:hypothetical protein
VNRAGTRRDREVIAERFDNIRQLRNRISHHEPIWKGRPDPGTGGRVPLTDQHAEIMDAVAWITPEVARAASAASHSASALPVGDVPRCPCASTMSTSLAVARRDSREESLSVAQQCGHATR